MGEVVNLIKVSKEDFGHHIILNRPKACNAFNLPMIHDFCDALATAEKDSNVRVVLISGVGDYFCAGGDVKLMEKKEEMFAGEGPELMRSYQQGIQRIPRIVEQMCTPIVASIGGPAVGAGCDLAAMCDLRIGSLASSFGETFGKIGLIAGDGGAYFLARAIGYSKALEMTLTGKIYSAQEAFEMGLLNFLVEDNLEEEAYNLCEQVAANAPLANSMAKPMLKAAAGGATLENILQLAASSQAVAQRSNDHFEGLKAFSQKRSPNFKGE